MFRIPNQPSRVAVILWGMLCLDSRVGCRFSSAISIGAVILTLVAATETKAQSLDDYFRGLYGAFGNNSITQVQVVSGPVAVQMNRDGVAGKRWIAESGEHQFKLTIQDSTGVGVGHLVERIRKLPGPYMRACEEVSDAGEDGIAIYGDLGGALAHGGKEYINLIPAADALVIAHEAGHALEQVATEGDPTIPNQWQGAIAADRISVSPYGDSSWWEDQAEFSRVYAVCLDAGSGPFTQINVLSPTRFALWEKILYPMPEASGTIISVNMDVWNAGEGFNAGNDPMGAGEVAGLVPAGNWNAYDPSGGGFHGAAPVDDSGATVAGFSVTTVSGSSNHSWNTGGLRNKNMFGDFGNPGELQITGVPYSGYDLIVYSKLWDTSPQNFSVDGGATVQTIINSVNGAPENPQSFDVPTSSNGVFVDGVHYTRFTGLSGDTTLTHAHMSSFQIVEAAAIPKSYTVALFQQGADSYSGTVDTCLQENRPAVDNSLAAELSVDTDDPGGSGLASQVLLRFDNIFGDGSGQIPTGPGVTITSARLELTTTNPGNGGALHRMLQPWSDSDTWDLLHGGVQANGVEAFPIADLVAGENGGVAVNVSSFDVTVSLQAWLADPESNLGWAFLPFEGDGWDFYSAEGAAPPRLIVNYVPEPGTLVMLFGVLLAITGYWKRRRG